MAAPVQATIAELSSRLWCAQESAWDVNERFAENTSGVSMKHRASYVIAAALLSSHQEGGAKVPDVRDRCRQMLLVTDKTEGELERFSWEVSIAFFYPNKRIMRLHPRIYFIYNVIHR